MNTYEFDMFFLHLLPLYVYNPATVVIQNDLPMNINYVIALTSLMTSTIAVLTGWRFYTRFGRGTGHWGWLLITTGSVSLAVSEFFDAYATFQGGSYAEFSDLFSILTEILLTVGFVRLFNRELVEEKLHHQKLESNLEKSENLLSAAMQMTASLNLEETLQTLLQRTRALTGADIAAIFLGRQPEKLAGRYFVARRDSDLIAVHEQSMGDLTEQILRSGCPIIMDNVRGGLKSTSANMPDRVTALGGFPLQDKGEILGALFVGFEQPHSFGKDQQLLLTSIADHGALALRNAVLFEEVEQLSLTDPLTRLANRRQFNQALAMELARARRYAHPLSLVILDVDHFKHINDTWGHPAGDAAIQLISGILREHIRVADLAARIGGDEMALILPHSGPDQAAQLTDRLRERVQQTQLLWDGNAIELTCSFGVSGDTGESLPEQPLDLYKRADAALYCAKESGRNCVIAR